MFKRVKGPNRESDQPTQNETGIKALLIEEKPPLRSILDNSHVSLFCLKLQIKCPLSNIETHQD